MTTDKIGLGRSGEELAVSLLKQRGFTILERNYKTRLGELDIIAFKGEIVCFIEVKTRTSLKLGSPFEAVTKRKQRKLSQLALMYLKNKKWIDKKARFDVIAVTKNGGTGYQIDIIEDAFECAPGYVY